MLITDAEDRVLLASNTRWPGRRVSILAGFVEPGESLEQAVIREVAEEAGIVVTNVRYVASQPWPMPRSLMVGFRAEAMPGEVIAVDHDELTEANWYSRADLLAAVTEQNLACPGRCRSPGTSSRPGTAAPCPPPRGPDPPAGHATANELGGQHRLRGPGFSSPGLAGPAPGRGRAGGPDPRAGHRPFVQRHGRFARRPGHPGRDCRRRSPSTRPRPWPGWPRG